MDQELRDAFEGINHASIVSMHTSMESLCSGESSPF